MKTKMSTAGKLRSLLAGSGFIMISRLAGAGVGFLTQFLLVKLMGAHHLGIFYAASSVASILGVIAAQGYPQVAARFVGRYRNKQDRALFGRFTKHAMRDGVVLAAVMGFGVATWALSWPGLSESEVIAYCVAGVMLLAIVTLNILTNVAGGMRKFNLCYLPEGLVRPILFFIVVLSMGSLGLALSAEYAMIAYATVTFCLAIAVAIALKAHIPHDSSARRPHPSLTRRWRVEAWQLVLLAIFTNFFADVGVFAAVPFLGSADVAVFGLCLKLALLVGYFVQIGQQTVVPDMADARHVGDIKRIRRAAWRSIILPSAFTAFALAVVYVFGDKLLSLFGPEFVGGQRALLILLTAQLLRALAGPSAHLLTLSGIQRINMGIAVSSLLVLFGSCAVLAPILGAEGGAFAVLLTYVYWIGVSAFALNRLHEPAVDVLWLALSSRDTGTAKA